MSKKDFDNYFIKIKNQYEQFKQVLDQVSKEAQNNATDIDFIENLKRQISPYKQNYERVLYIKFLLDQPVRKSKHKMYSRMISNKIKNLDENNSLDKVLEENEKIINSIEGKHHD